MSTSDSPVAVRVELPAYSHSFTVQLAPSSAVSDIKREIAQSCPGAPRPDGQRLVYKGHVLEEDQKVEDIWKSPDDARIVHLAVHPSAWTASPPALPSLSTASNAQSAHTVPSHAPHRPRTGPVAAMEYGSPLRYVVEKHTQALNVLINGTLDLPAATTPGRVQARRLIAIDILRNYGWSWPSILDEEFPPAADAGEGVKYERATIDGMPYLSLTTPNATPTPIQQHALKVLSVTFPILSMPHTLPSFFPPVAQYNAPYNASPATNFNDHLQQLGLPPIRVTPGQGPNPNLNPNDPNNMPVPAPAVEIRAIPLRALMVPLMMLVFRTLLIMYFFSPSKRPFFAFLLSAWIVYEAWGAVRIVFGGGRRRNRHRPNANGAGADPENGPPGQAGPGQARVPGVPNANRGQMHAVLAGLSNLNLRAEENALDGRARARAPSLGHRIKSFVALLLLTLYPAVWDHRRAALRRREGRLRTEANVVAAGARQDAEREGGEEREGEGEGGEGEGESAQRAEEQTRARSVLEAHGRRPAWVQQYVHRVQATDWADDL